MTINTQPLVSEQVCDLPPLPDTLSGLRDLFAGLAMAGDLAYGRRVEARQCYAIADRLLAARDE